MIAVHVVWGKTVVPRKAEVKALADVYRYVQAANGAEDDVLLVGDFNRNPTDAESYRPLMAIPSMTRLFDFPQKSHIKDTRLMQTSESMESQQLEDVTVYVTRTGKKYHLGSCSSLRRSKVPISLAEGKQQYGACSRCSPPR